MLLSGNVFTTILISMARNLCHYTVVILLGFGAHLRLYGRVDLLVREGIDEWLFANIMTETFISLSLYYCLCLYS